MARAAEVLDTHGLIYQAEWVEEEPLAPMLEERRPRKQKMVRVKWLRLRRKHTAGLVPGGEQADRVWIPAPRASCMWTPGAVSRTTPDGERGGHPLPPVREPRGGAEGRGDRTGRLLRRRRP